MTTTAPRTEDIATEQENLIRFAVGSERNLRRRACAARENHKQRESHAEKSAAEGGGRHDRDDTEHMGMDPTRPHRRRPSDYLFVGAGILVALMLVLWAFFG